MRRRDFCLSTLPLFGLSARAATLPRPSPELSITVPGQPPLLLSKYKGSVVALEFLLTTCPHCQKASVALEKIFKELRGKGFQALGVAINDGADPAQYAKSFGLSYPVGVARNETAIDYLQHPIMARMMMPQIVFVDRKFAIRSQYGGESSFFATNEEANMKTEVLKYLKEASSAPPTKSPAPPKPKKTS